MQVTLNNLAFEELDAALSPVPDPALPVGSLISGDITFTFGPHHFSYPDVSVIDCAAHFSMALVGYLVSPEPVFRFWAPDYSEYYVMTWSDEKTGRLAIYRNKDLVCEDISFVTVLDAMRDFNSRVRSLVDERYGPIDSIKHLFDVAFF